MDDLKEECCDDGSPPNKRIKLNNDLQQSPTEQNRYNVKKLEDFANSLGVSSGNTQLALTMWDDLIKRMVVSGREEKFFVCLLYIASIDLRLPYGSGDPAAAAGHLSPVAVTVSDLLAKSLMTVRQLIEMVKDIKECRHLSSTFYDSFLTLERKYCVAYVLFVKFERMFEEIFQQNSNGNLTPYDYHAKKKLVWTIFVYLKGKSLAKVGEFLTPFGLLLCCLDLVMSQTASVWLKAPFNNTELLTTVGSQQRFLPVLCEKYGAVLEEVTTVSESYFLPVKAALPQKDGQLECSVLCKAYMDMYEREGDINELLFLGHHPTLVPSDYAANNRPDNGSAGLATPVRRALSTVQQLQSLLTSASDQPSPKLLRFFKNCTVDPLPGILKRIENWRQKFVQELLVVYGASHSTMAEQKFKMALRLYYRVMETLLTQEEERLSRGDFSHLLSNMLFHASLLACSAQIVLLTYDLSGSNLSQSPSPSQSGLQFPWILGVLDVPVYDFYKVLESYMIAEPMLSKDAMKHLQQLETNIMESLAWQSGSSLYRSLEHCVPMENPPQNQSSALLYLSPHVERHPRGSSVDLPSSPSQSSNTNRRWSHSLSLFFQKVGRVGYQRIETLCNALDIPHDLVLKVWTTFEYCITTRHHLMKNRHIDQIMMCCIFGICKVMEREIPFKNIVSKYRTMTHAKQQTYKRVEIKPGEYKNVISFYNNIFLQDLKCYILKFTGDRQMPVAPAPRALPGRFSSPVYPVPGRRNFYVSPLKESPFKTPQNPGLMTPRTAQLYCFGEGNAKEKLKSINQSMQNLQSTGLTPTKSSSKRLDFDDQSDSVEGAADSPVKVVKRVVSMNSTQSQPGSNSGSGR